MKSLQHNQKKADEAVKHNETCDVLDRGFVRLVRYMGSDASVVQAARVSHGEGTKELLSDVKLLKYLIEHKHWSPFEQVALVFHMKLPIFVARQFIRHRTAKLNEMSARYTPMKPQFWMPREQQVRKQATKNKQSSAGVCEMPDELYLRWLESGEEAYDLYKDLLEAGVAREQARTVLPLSLYTEWYWQMDLRNLIGFLTLRDDSHAQWESQEYARAIKLFASMVAPETMKVAFPELDPTNEA